MNAEFTCTHCREVLPGYVADTLALGDRRAVQAHLADCAACQRELVEWRRLGEMAYAADAQVPQPGAAIAAATLAAIQAHLYPESLFAPGDVLMTFDQPELPSNDPIARQTAPARLDAPAPRRRTPLLASVAAILLVAFAATIFALRPHPSTPTPGSGLHPTATPPTHIATATPDLGSFNLIYQSAAIVAPNDIWAVGQGATGNAPQNVIAHFDGHQWSVASNTIFPNFTLFGISMDSATDGWAVGSATIDSQNDFVPLFLHYANGQWTKTIMAGPNAYLKQVWMFSADAGWAQGEDTSSAGIFYHFHQGTWTKVPFNPSSVAGAALSDASAAQAYMVPSSGTPPTSPYIVQAQMLSDTEGWAVGTFHNIDYFWHYLNGQWIAAYQEPIAPFGDFIGMGANAANDVWVFGTHGLTSPSVAMGKTFASERPFSNGGGLVLLHYNGQRWAQAKIDVWAGPPFLDGAHWLMRSGVDGSQQQDAVGLMHNQGGQWTATTFPQPVAGVISATLQSDGSTIAVAENGGSSSPQTLQVLRYANGTWTVVN